MDIPATLYHGSTYSDLKSLLPQKTLSKDAYIGDYVFATADKLLAIMYTVPKGFATIMNSTQVKPYIIIESEPEMYVLSDIPVFLYEMSGKTFGVTPQLELENYEFVSTEEVKVELSEIYDNSTDALMKNGVTIYFVNNDMFKQLILTKQNKNLLSSLVPYNSACSI